MASPDDTRAHHSDDSRRRDLGRPWYGFAARLLPDSPKAGGRWIDLGCGQGEFLELARARNLTGLGLDFWPSNARASLRQGRGAVVADLNRPLPFGDRALDGVSLIEVIEHIVRAEDLAAELARVIRPGGWLIITTPNVAHVRYRWRALWGRPPKQEGYHYRFFTQRKLRDVLERSGFALSDHASFGKNALLTKLVRLARADRASRFWYVVPRSLESLLALHFVWRLERKGAGSS